MSLSSTIVAKPSREEINGHTIKLIIGIIAISLATFASQLSGTSDGEGLKSISASYHAGPWSRNIFVGFLFAIGAFLSAYNGKSTFEMILSRMAAIAAIGVAVFPCKCDQTSVSGPNLHMFFAVSMFLILAVFCWIFLDRARRKPGPQAKGRVVIYALCGIALLTSMIVMALDMAFGEFISKRFDRLIFFGEATGLIAFGIAWLTASRTVPLITAEPERYSLSPYTLQEGR